MRAHWIKSGVWLCTLSLVSLAAAQSSLPADQYIRYRIHADPADVNSEVVFDVILGLEARERNGENVGWGVESLQFVRPEPGNERSVWSTAVPPVATPDGLWWVQHQSAIEPQAGEFLQPPLLQGVATPVDAEDGNLEYNLQGSTYQPAGPFQHTAALTYSLSTPESGILANGFEEPAEGDAGSGFPPV